MESKLVSLAPDSKVKGSSHKLQFERLRLNTKRNVLVRKAVCHWNTLSSGHAEPVFGLDALQRFLPLRHLTLLINS